MRKVIFGIAAGDSDRPPAGRVSVAVLLLPLATLALTACNLIAERPAPVEQIRAAESAVSRAEQVAGPSSPEVRIARDKLRNAHRAVEDENMVLAQRSAEQARADAELAIARTEAARAREAGDAIGRTLLPETK